MSETIYTLAERQRVYPEWTTRPVILQGLPAPIAGAHTVNVSLTRADELFIRCDVNDFVPDGESEHTTRDGTYKTTHYRQIRTRQGRFVGLSPAFFHHEDKTLDDVVESSLEELLAFTDRCRPTLRVNDGFHADWHDDFGTERIS